METKVDDMLRESHEFTHLSYLLTLQSDLGVTLPCYLSSQLMKKKR